MSVPGPGVVRRMNTVSKTVSDDGCWQIHWM